MKSTEQIRTERLAEIVYAIRALNAGTMREWRETYPEIYELSQERPLLVNSSTDNPLERMMSNLQMELQLRTAEWLLLFQDLLPKQEVGGPR